MALPTQNDPTNSGGGYAAPLPVGFTPNPTPPQSAPPVLVGAPTPEGPGFVAGPGIAPPTPFLGASDCGDCGRSSSAALIPVDTTSTLKAEETKMDKNWLWYLVAFGAGYYFGKSK